MKAVYCDWPECEHWEAGRCTKEVIRMYREAVVIKSTIEDPPTCSWYTERVKEKEQAE